MRASADRTQVEAIGHILAVSALLSIGMTLILYPYLHNVIPKKWYLITCETSSRRSIWVCIKS